MPTNLRLENGWELRVERSELTVSIHITGFLGEVFQSDKWPEVSTEDAGTVLHASDKSWAWRPGNSGTRGDGVSHDWLSTGTLAYCLGKEQRSRPPVMKMDPRFTFVLCFLFLLGAGSSTSIKWVHGTAIRLQPRGAVIASSHNQISVDQVCYGPGTTQDLRRVVISY